MTLDWVPGVGVAITGSFLSWWGSQRAMTAVLEERLKELRERLESHERETELLEGSVHGQIAEAVKELNHIATLLKVTIAEQSAFNSVNTKTLEGLVGRMEAMTMKIHQHDTDIALLDERVKHGGMG